MVKWIYTAIDPIGNVRVGSTEHRDTREKTHKRCGLVFVEWRRVLGDKTAMLKLERSTSRFYHMQSHEEDFQLINGDYKHSACHYCNSGV